MKKSPFNVVVLLGFLMAFTVPTCYFIAEQNNPNDPKNLNEDMGYPVADTGQTLCYNTVGDTIACEDDGLYARQDGYYSDKPNMRSFTLPITNSPYTDDYTTKDNVTSLVWRSCSQGWDGAACDNDNADPNTYTWADAVTECTALNSKNGGAGYAGLKTWRLPTIIELRTLANYGVFNPAIDVSSFPATQANRYWSSSTDIESQDTAWIVHFYIGDSGLYPKTSTLYVRCVANGR